MTAPLDRILPDPAHLSRFDVRVAASAEATWAAVRVVTPAELPVTRLLTYVRAMPGRILGDGHPGPADAADRPIVDQFVEAGFGVLVEEPPRLMIVGAAAQPWRLRGGERVSFAAQEAFVAFHRPDHVRIALSFELDPAPGGGTRLAAETRVTPTDAAAARKFGRYWTAIRLGGAVIRFELLRAVRRRAERTPEA